MQKGGFRGSITETDRMSARIERFQSEKTTVTYQVGMHVLRIDPYYIILL